MRILNFLIFKVLLVLGSEDFKVALVQTPPRRWGILFQRKNPGNVISGPWAIFILKCNRLTNPQSGDIRSLVQGVLGLLAGTLDEILFGNVLFRLSQPWQKVFTCSWSSVRPEIYDEYEREDLTIFFKYKTRRLSQTLVKIRHGADLRFVNSIKREVHLRTGLGGRSYGQQN